MNTRVPPTLYAVNLAECGSLNTLGHEEVTAAFGAALRRAGATIVHEVSHAFPGAGLTRVHPQRVHAVLHTWPETGMVNIEIFSCSTRLKSLEAINELSRSLARSTARFRKSLVLTDTFRGPTAGARFVLRGVAASLAFFGLLRLHWTEAQVVLPFTRAQAGLAGGLFGAPASPVEATLACSGADALALCLGAILAYPVTWRARLAALPAASRSSSSSTRCASAASVARPCHQPGSTRCTSMSGLPCSHWPSPGMSSGGCASPTGAHRPMKVELSAAQPKAKACGWFRNRRGGSSPSRSPSWSSLQPRRRSISRARSVLSLAAFAARAAAAILGMAGISAHAAANVLFTPRGGFLVTEECLATPLIPVYLAAVCAYATTWRRAALGLLAALPLFLALGIARLLVVALPDAASPLFLVHAFYQLLLAAVVVYLAALWRHRGRRAFGHALAGVVVGVLFIGLLGPLYTRVVSYPAESALADPQGALALLPAFQVGLYLALWVAAFVAAGWTRFLAGLALLGLTQTAGLVVLHALATHAGVTAHVRDIRALAIAGPVLIFAAVINLARARR